MPGSAFENAYFCVKEIKEQQLPQNKVNIKRFMPTTSVTNTQ